MWEPLTAENKPRSNQDLWRGGGLGLEGGRGRGGCGIQYCNITDRSLTEVLYIILKVRIK